MITLLKLELEKLLRAKSFYLSFVVLSSFVALLVAEVGEATIILFSTGQPAIRRAINDVAVAVVSRAVAGAVPSLLA